MSDALLDSYETLSYESKPIALADVDSIAANAMLHGVTPPAPDTARVLELGCASGGNIVSMAYAFPKARFVGVDLSPRQIDAGRLFISEMGLQNVRLDARSIDAIDESFGEFDYIICHGVYSWVPPLIQDAILRVSARHLAPNGVAYVSYNTYPGWHQRRMLRDMLVYHDDRSLPPDVRISRARDFSKFLGSFDPQDLSVHVSSLRAEHQQLLTESDVHLFHEQLEEYNEPVYFAEFAKRAAGHGLRFLAEARPSRQTHATATVRKAVAAANDVIRSEQYVDFVLGRTFRRTLLCHANIDVAHEPQTSAVQGLHFRARCVRVDPSEEDAGESVEAFRSAAEATLTTNNPLIRAILHELMVVSPSALPFAELQRRITARLASEPESIRALGSDLDAITSVLLQCTPTGHIELRSQSSRFVTQAGKRPKASALARFQASFDDTVTSLGHWAVTLSGMERFILLQLDGSSDRDQLIRTIEQAMMSGDLKVDKPITRETLIEVLDDVLARLGRSALLVS